MSGVDGILVESSKKGGDCGIDWPVRIFSLCMDHAFVLMLG